MKTTKTKTTKKPSTTKKANTTKKTPTKKVTNTKKTVTKTREKKQVELRYRIIDFIKEYRKIIIGILALIFIFVIIYSTTHYGPFENMKKKLNNKETFVVVIANDESLSDSYKSMLDYYKDAYNFKYTYINLNEWPPTTYDKLVKIMKLDKNILTYPYLLYVEKGKMKTSSNSVIDENGLKNFLVNAKITKEEYKEKDYLLNDDEFDKFINDKNGNILFYTYNDANVYKYRKELLKANVKCSIIYAERLNNQVIENRLRKMFKLKDADEFNLPMLIKFKSGKIVDSKDNIGINRLIKVYKELEQK